MAVINGYPNIEIRNPPNVTMADPLKDMNYKEFIRACGCFLLVFGATICAISVIGLVGMYRKARRLTMMVLIDAYFIHYLIIDLQKYSFYYNI